MINSLVEQDRRLDQAEASTDEKEPFFSQNGENIDYLRLKNFFDTSSLKAYPRIT